MTKALMGLENLSYGMENSRATHWPPDVSCNAKMVVDGLKMAVLPQTHSTIPSPAAPKTCKQVIDLTDDDLLQATTPIEQSEINGAISDDSSLRCTYCQQGFNQLKDLENHAQICAMRPPPILTVPSPSVESKEEDPPVISPKPIYTQRWCQNPIHPDDQPRYPFGEYVEYLHLAPKSKTGELLKEDKPHHDVECMDLDLDEEPCIKSSPTVAPSTPTTPRSAKRLLSQLSRDFSPPPVKSPRIKSLSEENNTEKSVEKGEKKDQEQVVVGDLDLDPDFYVDSDSESEREVTDGKYAVKVRSSASLLTIDFSSPLGTRIKDKYNYKRPKPVEGSEDEPDGYEKYTKPQTRSFNDRLRNRENDGFPITFNKRKRIPDHRCHWITFTKRDREEFKMVLKTGLTARARRLKRKLKPCSVKLKRITEEEIKKWRRKPNPFQRWPYQRSLENLYPLANYPHPVPAHLQNAQMQQRMLMQQQRQLQLQRSGLIAPQWATGGALPVHLTKNMFAPQLNGMPNGHFNKRPSSSGTKSKDDLICISSDEEDNSDVKVTASKAPTQDAQKKSSQAGIIRFKCHLCAAEINGQLGSTDFIAEHFGKRHDVHNIRLHQSVDVNGQTVVTIVQDIPKGASNNNNNVAPTNANAQSCAPPPQRNSSVTKPAPMRDDEIICLD